jgi:hypothetical protein
MGGRFRSHRRRREPRPDAHQALPRGRRVAGQHRRKPEQAQILRELGAVRVLNSTSPTFMADLTEALAETSATLAFDAIGGGQLAGHILTGMEAGLMQLPPTDAHLSHSGVKLTALQMSPCSDEHHTVR